jgi:hypothetical protein
MVAMKNDKYIFHSREYTNVKNPKPRKPHVNASSTSDFQFNPLLSAIEFKKDMINDNINDKPP